MIIAHTVKGKGISFAENTAAFHNNLMTNEQWNLAMEELDIKIKELEDHDA
jgi:transketolase